ncbi:MurR/RpiR family transcriptional regulator [Vibrio scophthalmi]|uniref:MurR/RpiR family transcriptional regulator n=1 Tax=Vibrio scophthalmi TaxID=45658 RepID=UPI003EBA3190
MSITNKLVSKRTQLSTNGVKIADWVLANTEQAMALTSQEIANVIGVSQSSIVKFTQRIGFKGYSQFKLALAEEVSRKQTLQAAPLHTNISVNDSTRTIIQKLVKAKTEAIFKTSDALDCERFDDAITQINSANKVQIVGMGASALSAKDLGYKLLKLGILAITEMDSHVQIGMARTLTSNDVQVVFSFQGNTKEINLAAETAKEKGATVIALTSPQKSVLRNIADICLDTVADESAHRASSMAARTAQQVIADAIFITLVKLRGDDGQDMINEIASQIKRL